jgi:chemotaxis response regulator CheB
MDSQCKAGIDWNRSVHTVARSERARILVVDDFEPWRQAICRRLEQTETIQVVGQSADGLDAVDQSIQLQPDVVLLDTQLSKINGLMAGRLIRNACPSTRILF